MHNGHGRLGNKEENPTSTAVSTRLDFFHVAFFDEGSISKTLLRLKTLTQGVDGLDRMDLGKHVYVRVARVCLALSWCVPVGRVLRFSLSGTLFSRSRSTLSLSQTSQLFAPDRFIHIVGKAHARGTSY